MIDVVAEIWHCPRRVAREATPEDFFKSLKFHSARNRGLADKSSNERNIEEANRKARGQS